MIIVCVKVIDINDERDFINGNLGNCLCKLQKYKEAMPYLKKSLLRANDYNHSYVGPICLKHYAKIVRLNKNYQESVEWMKKLIETNTFLFLFPVQSINYLNLHDKNLNLIESLLYFSEQYLN